METFILKRSSIIEKARDNCAMCLRDTVKKKIDILILLSPFVFVIPKVLSEANLNCLLTRQS